MPEPTDDREHDHPHGPPWVGRWRDGPTWGSGKPPWWPDDEEWPPSGSDAWRGMRRRFVGKFLIGVAVFFALVVGLAALIGGVLFQGDEHRGLFFFPLGLIVLILAVVFVVRAGRRFASPVADVMEAADRVAAGDYEARVRERGPREVRQLGHAFNEMAERLGTNEERRRQLLADVAHELRTPLSVIQANLEAVLDGLYPLDEAHVRPVLEETKVMSRLLNDLQTLSTAEAGALVLHREPIAPRALLDAAALSFAAQAKDADVRLEARAADDLPTIEVDPLRIGEVLGNLVANALRHTPPGGEVTLAAERGDDGVVVRVRDTGSGIDPDRLPHVFDRFSKTPDSSGAGLGLAIAKTLVEAHGGAIRAASDASGTTIAFTLPVAGR
jgi:signal transduction histidine kinase